MVLTDSTAELIGEFNRTVLCPEDEIDMARAGLLISRLAYPDLDEPFYLAELDRLAGRLKTEIKGLGDVYPTAQMMARVLYEEEGFRGNLKDYYDPDNSYLNRVLDRRTGIPVALCLVYMEVGRRAGLLVRGIGMPGHFIVGIYGAGGRRLIDPFYRGAFVEEDQYRRRVAVQHGGAEMFGPRFPAPMGPKAMLVRLLRNLRGVYMQMGDDGKSLQTIELIITLDPCAAAEFRTRGFIYESMGAFELAARDLEKYLSLAPDCPDAGTIMSGIVKLKDKRSTLH